MQKLRKIVYPLSVLYGWVTGIRNFLYNKGILTSSTFETPTIVVGNLSVGGTGKTPQIEYLISMLQDNYKVAVLSRGYKRNSKGFQIADENSTADSIGDEPYQYYTKFSKIVIAVDSDRRNGIEQLKKMNQKPDVILLDDAFQHRRISGGMNILLTAYDDLYVYDTMLPTGNLREKKSGASRAQIIIVTKCPDDITQENMDTITRHLNVSERQQVFFSKIIYNEKLSGSKALSVDQMREMEVLLVTGIANPKPLTDFLDSRQVNYNHMKYADHFAFNNKDITEIKAVFDSFTTNNKLILTTEKDYVRIFGRLKNIYFLAIKTSFIKGQNLFDKEILNYVGKSTRNGSISKK